MALRREKQILGSGMRAHEVEHVHLPRNDEPLTLEDIAQEDELWDWIRSISDMGDLLRGLAEGAQRILRAAKLPDHPEWYYECRADRTWLIISRDGLPPPDPSRRPPRGALWTGSLERCVRHLGIEPYSLEDYAARGLDLIDRIWHFFDAGHPTQAARLAFDLGVIVTESRIFANDEKSWNRGEKVVTGARQGHESVHGTSSEKQKRWNAMAAKYRALMKQGNLEKVAAADVADQFRVSLQTVRRAAKRIKG